jgi:hypothetical protein
MYNEVCFMEESGEPNYFLILRDAGAEKYNSLSVVLENQF